jgi:hypothetical protein
VVLKAVLIFSFRMGVPIVLLNLPMPGQNRFKKRQSKNIFEGIK